MHQSILKETLIGKAQEMGIDTFQVQDIIEERGIWENNMEIILDLLNKPNLVNPLKFNAAPQYMGNQFGGAPQMGMGGGGGQFLQMNSMNPNAQRMPANSF